MSGRALRQRAREGLTAHAIARVDARAGRQMRLGVTPAYLPPHAGCSAEGEEGESGWLRYDNTAGKGEWSI